MDRLDKYVENTLIPAYTQGEVRGGYPEYSRLRTLSAYYRKVGKLERAETIRRQAQQYPSVDPNDPKYRRLRYVRYADDFLLGFAGPQAEAEEIRERLTTYLKTELNLTLAVEKTLITHATTGRARFLGYEIGSMESRTKFDNLRRRAVNGKIGLYIPENVLQRKRKQYLRGDTIIHRAELSNDSEYDIIIRYPGVYKFSEIICHGFHYF